MDDADCGRTGARRCGGGSSDESCGEYCTATFCGAGTVLGTATGNESATTEGRSGGDKASASCEERLGPATGDCCGDNNASDEGRRGSATCGARPGSESDLARGGSKGAARVDSGDGNEPMDLRLSSLIAQAHDARSQA